MRLAEKMGLLSRPRLNQAHVAAINILSAVDSRLRAEDFLRQYKSARAAVAPEDIPTLFPRPKTAEELAQALEDGTATDDEIPWTIPESVSDYEDMERVIAETHSFVHDEIEDGDDGWR